jgi:hypothetical protein
MDIGTIRAQLMQIVATKGNSFQQGSILRECAQALKIGYDEGQQHLLLTCWYDLFRNGYLSWGLNLDNPNPPFCHLTEIGRKALENFSRDPANTDGYLSYLRNRAGLNDVARSYIVEALATYNANCFKSTAVMIGCATESLILELRDELVTKLLGLKRPYPKQLDDWRIKTVLDAFEVEMMKISMSRQLKERFEAQWPAFTFQIRNARNDAGHPKSIDPVTQDSVHASLLIFPEIANLQQELKKCIDLMT